MSLVTFPLASYWYLVSSTACGLVCRIVSVSLRRWVASGRRQRPATPHHLRRRLRPEPAIVCGQPRGVRDRVIGPAPPRSCSSRSPHVDRGVVEHERRLQLGALRAGELERYLLPGV